MTDSNIPSKQISLESIVRQLREAGGHTTDSPGRLYWLAADKLERQQRDIAERDKLIAAAGRATQLADQQATELERLRADLTAIRGLSRSSESIAVQAIHEIASNALSDDSPTARETCNPKPPIIGENGPMTSGDCARWLEAKYARHHELEDKASADLIRWQAAEIARLKAMDSPPETKARVAEHEDIMPWEWRPPSICRAAPFRYADPPQDCDAPFCGCVPEWTAAIEMLQECGWKSPDELRKSAQETTAPLTAAEMGTVARMAAVSAHVQQAERMSCACPDGFCAVRDGFCPLDSSGNAGAECRRQEEKTSPRPLTRPERDALNRAADASVTVVDTICSCGKRLGEHPAQPPWWPCMLTESPVLAEKALRELTASEAASFDRTFARSPRRVEETSARTAPMSDYARVRSALLNCLGQLKLVIYEHQRPGFNARAVYDEGEKALQDTLSLSREEYKRATDTPERGGPYYEGEARPDVRGERTTGETGKVRPAAPVSDCSHAPKASDGWRCVTCGHENPPRVLKCQNPACLALTKTINPWASPEKASAGSAAGASLIVSAEEAKQPMAFRHWSKDPIVPYRGCHCDTCSAVNGRTDGG